MPPLSNLLAWQTEISTANKMATEKFYVKCSNYGNLDADSIRKCIALHSSRDVKIAVSQEIDWFNQSKTVPRSVHKTPPVSAVNAFKSLIMNHPATEQIEGYDMTPKELAVLCCKRYITCDHVMWSINQCNKQQEEVWCVYMNFVNRIENRISCYLKKRNNERPKKICFIINVGKMEGDRVFVGSDVDQGCHWTIAVYDREKNQLIYGDSLGWEMPNEVIIRLKEFVSGIWKDWHEPEVVYCHDPLAHKDGIRACGDQCTVPYYPLQSCSTICGVVAIIMSAMVCLNYDCFEGMFKKDKQPYFFMKEPSKYNKYLRNVLMSWIAEKFINIDYVTPPTIVSDLSSDSDEDINIVRTEIKIEPPLKSKPPKSVPQVKHSGNKKEYKCADCSQTCNKKANLIRHINRFHGNSGARKELESGNCLCIQCGHRCRRITELKKHLFTCHNVVFRTEQLSFESMKGKIFLTTKVFSFRFCLRINFCEDLISRVEISRFRESKSCDKKN